MQLGIPLLPGVLLLAMPNTANCANRIPLGCVAALLLSACAGTSKEAPALEGLEHRAIDHRGVHGLEHLNALLTQRHSENRPRGLQL